MKAFWSCLRYSCLVLCGIAWFQCKTAQQTCSGGVLSGRVLWSEGNFMPSPSGDPRPGPVPVERKIVVHALTDMDGVDRSDGPLYDRIRTEQIAVLEADREGAFAGCLPPGEYSVFTVEEDGFFANRFDGEGHIQPVTIRTGDTTDIVIDINYRAYY